MGDPCLPPYVAITPVKDEAEHLARTALAMVAQTHRPRRWVIVDDGSSDRTAEIATSFAGDHEWMEVMSSGVSGARARGAPIVRAFNAGLAAVREPFAFVVKLDGDLSFPATYFERVAQTFEAEPRAGIAGGVVLIEDRGEWRRERMDPRTVHGAIKAYRRECFEDIGGLDESMGWDGIDEYAARARGWDVHVLADLEVQHHKQRGSAQPWLKARMEEGRGAHYMGYRWRAVALRAAYRALVERPRVLSGSAIAAGYLQSALRAEPQADPLAREQLRREQRGMLSARLRR